MDKLTLTVEPRTLQGRKVKTLRRQGILPGNIFGKKTASTAVQVKLDEFTKIFAKAGETSVIDLKLTGETKDRPVLISNIARNPVTEQFVHVDFRQVDLHQKVVTTVPVELVGESPAEKDLGGIIVQQINELEIEALPTDIPEKLEVDITKLKAIGDSLTIGDIKFDTTKITIKEDLTQVIVSAQAPKEEVEETPAVEAPEAEAATAPETPVAEEQSKSDQ